MTDGTEVMVDRESGVVVLNETQASTSSVYDALIGPHPEVATLMKWAVTNYGDVTGRSRQGGIFDRDRYITPGSTFGQFKTAQDAASSDDVVSAYLASTESLAFGQMSFHAEDEDEEQLWNQIAFDLDLDSRLREMWRELATVSQVYMVTWWGRKDYKLKGKTPAGVTRKKVYKDLVVPLGLTILDPMKVVPVGNLMFNQEQLAYICDRTEVDMLDAAVLNDPNADPVSRQIIVAKYAPPDFERRNLAKHGINADFLYILNPKNVWRHTVTRPQYRRFADVRMVSIFSLLDLKHQLQQMDRAFLLGGTNYIVLIRKGTDHLPAKPAEVNNLNAMIKNVTRIPILVGDHRLSVEIVTPKQDYTLSNDKYSVLDSRIMANLYQMFVIHGGSGASGRSDDSLKLSKLIAKGMEARRYMMRRELERQVIHACVEANDELTSDPHLVFHPNRIELAWDPALTQWIMDLRGTGDLSRDTVLTELDYDQATEAIKRQREARDYDKWFTIPAAPFSEPGPGHAVAVAPGGKPKDAPAQDAPGAPGLPDMTPHSHAPDGTPVPLPAPAATAKPAAKPAGGTTTKKAAARTAGRTQGGRKNGGGAAPGSGQGQEPRTGTPKAK